MIVSDASFDQGVYSSYTERIAAIEYADECDVQPIRFSVSPDCVDELNGWTMVCGIDGSWKKARVLLSLNKPHDLRMTMPLLSF